MESLVPFLSDGLGVKILFHCVLKDHSDILGTVSLFSSKENVGATHDT